MIARGSVSYYLPVVLCLSLALTACGGGSNSGGSTPSATDAWTWISGSSTTPGGAEGPPGVYGTEGTPSTSNTPGGRWFSAGWSDSSGNLWLFGGAGSDSNGAFGFLSDLWEFSPANKTWTWVSGSSTVNAPASYGSVGVPSTSNTPGGRYGSVGWSDNSGNLWLFGGAGSFDLNGTYGFLGDLWEFNPANKTWTWVSGSSTVNASGSYGTPGVFSTSNTPGARGNSLNWRDSSGNFWLFGGYCTIGNSPFCSMNDLWEFNPANKTWTWVSGSSTANVSGSYGTLGVPSISNTPGSRADSVTWMDGKGNFWLFGGSGLDSNGTLGFLGDLWEFNPANKTWTWVGGSSTGNVSGSYGTQGVPSTSNTPGSRIGSAGWTDSSGNLWLFGGRSEMNNPLNDLWEFNPANQTWTWVSGSGTVSAPGNYGILDAPSTSNMPGARESSVSWTDSGSNFWLFGGGGYDSAGTYGYLNDLWFYHP